ncbi:MAG: permease prefix domain 1-containing protein, partial [Planctomycetota bacterium]
MSGFDPLVERATRRLSRDRELRGEVSRELASHLAASAAEYRSAGYAEANADAAAAKDFGDPDDVADALWEANRFRVRLRAWGWWAARLTLVPACVAAACWMMLPTLATSAAMANLSQGNWVSVSPVMRWYDRRVRARMTADQRLIAFGDESAPDELARWSAVRDAHPHDPLAQLRVVEEAMVRVNSAAAGHPSPGATVETEAVRLRAELDRLDGLQPDNALVPLVRAYLDLWQVTLQDRNAPDAAVMIETLNRNAAEPARVETYIRRLAGPVDEAALAAGLAHLAEAAERPYLGTYPLSRMARRFGALPPPRTMRDHLHRMGEEIALRLPALGHYRRVNQVVCGEAIRRAEAGEVAGAIGLLDQLAAVNRKQAAGAETLIGVLVARTNAQWERATRVAVWRATGDEAKAAEALAYSDALERFWRREWVAKRADAASGKSGSGSLLVGDLASAVPGFDVDATPFRKSEYVQFDRAALLLGLVLL